MASPDEPFSSMKPLNRSIKRIQGDIHADRFTIHQRLAGTIRRVDGGIGEPAPVADEPAVHGIVAPCRHLEQFAVAGHRDGIAAERAVRADRGGHVVIPVAGAETGGLVGEDAGRADIHQVAGEGGFQLARPAAARSRLVPARPMTPKSVPPAYS